MKMIICPICGGIGEIGWYFQLDDGSIDDDIRECPECKGKGEVEEKEERMSRIKEDSIQWDKLDTIELVKRYMCATEHENMEESIAIAADARREIRRRQDYLFELKIQFAKADHELAKHLILFKKISALLNKPEEHFFSDYVCLAKEVDDLITASLSPDEIRRWRNGEGEK